MAENEEQKEAAAPSEEELLRKVEEQLRDLKVADVLLQTLYTISSLGWHKLSSSDRDLEQARLAIEALRALLPVLADSMPAEVKRDLEQMVANMQLAYASAVAETEAKPGETEAKPGETEAKPAEPEADGDS